jgi:hypothetical protein
MYVSLLIAAGAYYVFRKVIYFFIGTQEGFAVFLDEKVTKNQVEKKPSARPAFQTVRRRRFETAFPPTPARFFRRAYAHWIC